MSPMRAVWKDARESNDTVIVSSWMRLPSGTEVKSNRATSPDPGLRFDEMYQPVWSVFDSELHSLFRTSRSSFTFVVFVTFAFPRLNLVRRVYCSTRWACAPV